MSKKLKITILGTATSIGVPMLGCTCPTCQSIDPKDRRTRSSIFIEYQNEKILIDVGPDFRQQALNQGVHDIDHVLLTHEHTDHVNGLDDLRPLNFIHKKAINFYAETRVLKEIETRFNYIFDPKGIRLPRLNVHEIKPGDVTIGKETIQAIRVMHGELPILGFKLENFAYLTDAKKIDSAETEQLMNLDLLIVNALRREEHHKHFTLQEALDFISMVKPKKALLTHLSHALPKHAELNNELPTNVSVAYDGMTISIQ